MSVKLRIDSISKSFEKKILDGITFTAEDSQLYILEGENGSGKTTLLKIIADLVKPDGGALYLNDQILCNDREAVSYCSSNPNTFFQKISALENLRYFSYLFSNTQDFKNNDAYNILDIGSFENKKFFELSTGMKITLSLFREILKNRKILLLDESLAHFPEKKRNLIFNYLLQLAKKQKKIIILSSHQKIDANVPILSLANGKIQCL